MLVSVFTPSHIPDHLKRCWESLLAQTHQEFEWVVVPNGNRAAAVEDILRKLDDPRIKIHTKYSSSIGELKRYACDNSKGEVLVEYDHDDLLATACLKEIVKVVEAHPVSFIYSDNHTCKLDGTAELFSPQFGWSYYGAEIPGHGMKPINRTPPITPRSLCEILYAPDHVRAWTQQAYLAAGKHDPSRVVADDHDLMIRTYLAQVPFVKINIPLYIHYWDSGSTSRQRVEQIQKDSLLLRDHYLHKLVAEWCRREGLRMIDLGGAFNCPDGYEPLDLNPEVLKHPKGMQGDIRSGTHWFTNGQLEKIGCFRMVDFIEHIPSTDVPALMNTLYNLLPAGGWLLTKTPAVCDNEGKVGRGAFQDPTHVSCWSPNNWWYYTNSEFAKYIPEYKGRFQIVRNHTEYPTDWHRENLIPYVVADMCKLENGVVQPGQKFI